MEYYNKRYLKIAKIFKNRKKVLDIGCGSGPFLKACETLKIEANGIDISSEKVEICKSYGYNVERKSALELDFKENSFDGVFCGHIVEHFHPNEFQKLIQGIYNILSTNGLLVILTPNPKNPFIMRDSFWNDWTHVKPYSHEAITSLLKIEKFIELKKEILPTKKINPLFKLFFTLFFGKNYGDVLVIAKKLEK